MGKIKELRIKKGDPIPRYCYLWDTSIDSIRLLRGWAVDVEKAIASGNYSEQTFNDQFDRGSTQAAVKEYFALIWSEEPEENEFGVVSP